MKLFRCKNCGKFRFDHPEMKEVEPNNYVSYCHPTTLPDGSINPLCTTSFDPDTVEYTQEWLTPDELKVIEALRSK